MSEQLPPFTPVFDNLVQELGPTTALVYGRVWRFCQMPDGLCRASQAKLASLLNIRRETVNHHLAILVGHGYLEDLTPHLVNRPHLYKDTGKANSPFVAFQQGKSEQGTVLEKRTVGNNPEGVSFSNSSVSFSNSSVTKTNTHCEKNSQEESIKKQLKKELKIDAFGEKNSPSSFLNAPPSDVMDAQEQTANSRIQEEDNTLTALSRKNNQTPQQMRPLDRLAAVFTGITSIDAPKGKGEKAGRWDTPLAGILEAARGDDCLAAVAMRAAFRKMRNDDMSIAAPGSVEKVTKTILSDFYLKIKGDQSFIDTFFPEWEALKSFFPNGATDGAAKVFRDYEVYITDYDEYEKTHGQYSGEGLRDWRRRKHQADKDLPVFRKYGTKVIVITDADIYGYNNHRPDKRYDNPGISGVTYITDADVYGYNNYRNGGGYEEED